MVDDSDVKGGSGLFEGFSENMVVFGGGSSASGVVMGENDGGSGVF